MEWLQPYKAVLPPGNAIPKLRLLEVGALTTTNACSRSLMFETTRIDLNSREKGILQQDFMQRPLPATDEERFDLISLSLVLNYVPEPIARGDMLRRTVQFLRARSSSDIFSKPDIELFPSLFLVLPAPCVTNSRYLNEEWLGDIMRSLGYLLLKRKLSTKLIYYLWRQERSDLTPKSFRKTEVNRGRNRNNFAIILP